MVDRIDAWRAGDGTIHATREAAERRNCECLLADTIYKHLMTTGRVIVLYTGMGAATQAQEIVATLMPIAAEVATILSRYIEASKREDTVDDH